MATLDSLRVDTETILYDVLHDFRPWEDTLVAAITAGATVMELAADDDVWKRGDIAEFVDNGEMVILATDHPADGNDVTVRRGQRSTTAASQSLGAVVRRNPMFPIEMIERWVNQTIDIDLNRHPKVYTVNQRSLTWSDDDFLYPLNTVDDDVIEIYQYDIETQNDLKWFPNGWWDVVTPNTAVSATKAIQLRTVRDQSLPVYYSAKSWPKSSGISDLSDDIAEVVPWRAASKALRARMPRVIEESGQPRTALADTLALWDLEFTQGKSAIRQKLRREYRQARKYRGPRQRRDT